MKRDTATIIRELTDAARCTCDADLEGTLRDALVLLRASECATAGCERRPEVGRLCRPCYQRRRRKGAE